MRKINWDKVQKSGSEKEKLLIFKKGMGNYIIERFYVTIYRAACVVDVKIINYESF